MIQIPQWRMKPEPVLLNCLGIYDGNGGSELVVQFETQRGHFTAFVRPEQVEREENGLHAFIIADVDEGYLVEMPSETFTSGSRILVFTDEKDRVLKFRDWTSAYDT